MSVLVWNLRLVRQHLDARGDRNHKKAKELRDLTTVHYLQAIHTADPMAIADLLALMHMAGCLPPALEDKEAKARNR